MKDSFLKTPEETQAWLDEMGVTGYTIHDDLTVDVAGAVDVSKKNLTRIPVQFGVVTGDFNCTDNQLISLIGSPKKCEDFNCSDNQLTGLIGAPELCVDFDCGNNQLTSLIGAPKECFIFGCDNNRLTNLVGSPSRCYALWCRSNHLVSLDGAPSCNYLHCHGGNLDLYDINGAADGCQVHYEHKLVARNRAIRDLSAMKAGNAAKRHLKPKSGRKL